jgi:acyl dehydratase
MPEEVRTSPGMVPGESCTQCQDLVYFSIPRSMVRPMRSLEIRMAGVRMQPCIALQILRATAAAAVRALANDHGQSALLLSRCESLQGGIFPMNAFEIMQATEYPQIEQSISPRDAMLYALAIGFGDDPLDPDQLKYVYEKDLEVFSTMAITLCYPGTQAIRSDLAEIDMRKTLHVFQGLELLNPIPLDRKLIGNTRITGVYDKGAGRGILWTYENRIQDGMSGVPICILHGASMCLADGGVGGPRGQSQPKRAFPDRPADIVRDIKTLPQAALIYRLSGDYNPFHVDPSMAKEGGFSRPILHGRCTFGIAGRAITEEIGRHRGGLLQKMEARFTSPVFPGETICTEMWENDSSVLFRCRTRERGALVLDQGYARLR